MRIKIDENLPARLVDVLASQGHEADTVRAEGLTGRNDATVWQAAQTGGCFLITQDMDFSDRRVFRPGTHCGVLLLRLGSPGRTALLERVRSLFQTEDVENWTQCFVVATDRKVRISRPRPETPRETPR